VNLRWTILLVSALLAGAAQAAPGDRKDVVRNLAGRVGPIVGSALACRDVARPRIQVIADKFTAVITEFSASEAERADLTQLLDRNVADGRAGFAGVAKAFRALGVDDSAILRLNYQCNTVDADDAVDQLKLQKPPIKAVVIAAVYPAAAKFIEKTHDFFPGMIYTNVSGVGGTALADELILPEPRYAAGAIVTQVVPAVSGYSSVVLEYKNALAKYFSGEAPDYVSLEGFVSANILIQALKRAGPQLDTEKLIDVLENMRNLDPGLGVPLSFGRAEHQASHKIWATAIDENGKYQAIELE
jgi:branched-chain amino acid transport system substrate-binding protein